VCACVMEHIIIIIIIITYERSTRLGTRNNEARSPRQRERVAFFYFSSFARHRRYRDNGAGSGRRLAVYTHVAHMTRVRKSGARRTQSSNHSTPDDTRPPIPPITNFFFSRRLSFPLDFSTLSAPRTTSEREKGGERAPVFVRDTIAWRVSPTPSAPDHCALHVSV